MSEGQADEVDALRRRVDELSAEVDRLRDLVGPSEQSYLDLRRDLLAASDAVRGAQAAEGVQRGRVIELEVELARARQDQDHFQRVVVQQVQAGRRRVGRALRARFF